MTDGHNYLLRTPADPSAVSLARAVVRHLAAGLAEDQAARAQTIVSELVTNAVRHGSPAGGSVTLELTVGADGLDGCVSDHGPAFTPTADAPAGDQTGGFGLHIVREMAADWQISRTEKGNAISFSV